MGTAPEPAHTVGFARRHVRRLRRGVLMEFIVRHVGTTDCTYAVGKFSQLEAKHATSARARIHYLQRIGRQSMAEFIEPPAGSRDDTTFERCRAQPRR